jgi:hypothetical protein
MLKLGDLVKIDNIGLKEEALVLALGTVPERLKPFVSNINYSECWHFPNLITATLYCLNSTRTIKLIVKKTFFPYREDPNAIVLDHYNILQEYEE